MVGAVLGEVPEGLLHQHQVEGGAADGGHRRVGQRPGVGGVEQPAARGGDVVQHRGARAAVPRVEDADVVPADPVPLARAHRHEVHGGVRGDPHPAGLDDLRRAEHVERRVADPGPEQQERRRAVVGVPVGDQHVPQPGEVEAETLHGARGLRAAVEQQPAVDQRGGLPAHPPGRPLHGARRAAAERVGPAVGRPGAERHHVQPGAVGAGHRWNTTGTSNAARRAARRSARSSALPARASTSSDIVARPRSHSREVVR